MALPVNKRVLKILFILFVVAFCVYLVPRVAINFFYYPDDKLYGPDPWSAESVEFTAKDGTRLQGWFIPSSTGPADNAIATIIHAHGNAGNMSGRWSVGYPSVISTLLCLIITGLVNQKARRPRPDCWTIRKAPSMWCAIAVM